jgi:hypothetical protein
VVACTLCRTHPVTTRHGHITLDTHCKSIPTHLRVAALMAGRNVCARRKPVTALPSPPPAAPSSGPSVGLDLYALAPLMPASLAHVVHAIDRAHQDTRIAQMQTPPTCVCTTGSRLRNALVKQGVHIHALTPDLERPLADVPSHSHVH